MGAFSVVFPVSLPTSSTSKPFSMELDPLPRTRSSRTREQRSFFTSVRILKTCAIDQRATMDSESMNIAKRTRLLPCAKVMAEKNSGSMSSYCQGIHNGQVPSLATDWRALHVCANVKRQVRTERSSHAIAALVQCDQGAVLE